ncbi:MAG: TonB-dependent receptor [Gammaproteobacteria bacterium]|nr:TonB-dependent receptor [Gammaproteobacteria bacterium]
MEMQRFAKSKIAVAVATAVASVFSAVVSAQTENLDEILVVGSRASLSSAIQKQRESDKVSGVIDADAIGNFADINVAESLRRISGIMVENDQGEGRYVTVRGMNTDLNSMTINGVTTAAPEDRRGIILDGVPSDLLQTMTVYKTLTPDLDADTIGGAIDLETITAFSYDDRFVRVKAETSRNDLTKDASNPKLAATFADRWDVEGGELGVALVLSDQTRRIIAHNNETGGWGDAAPNDDFETRFYDLERDRSGIVLNLDYVADSGNTYYAHMFHNEYTDTEWRAKWETRDGLEDNEAVVNGSVFSYADSKVDTEGKNRTEIRTIDSAQFGAKFVLNDRSNLDIEFFMSQAEQDDTRSYNAIFRSGKVNSPITYDNSDPQKPVVTFPSEFANAGLFNLKAWESDFSLNTDEISGGTVDYSYSVNDSTEFRAGAKLSQREKINNFNFCAYEPIEDANLADYNFLTLPKFLNTSTGPTPTFEQVRAFQQNLGSGSFALSDGTTCRNPGTFFEMSGDEEEESIPADWTTEEDVMAFYAMATTQSGPATWIYGLRYEDTKTTYSGKSFDGDAFAGNVAYKNDYSFFAPSLNLKYELADDQLLRVGLFRSLVRPGFKESRAGAIVNVEDNEIAGGNPSLNPTRAWNFDVSFEYYVSTETFFGAGVFYKQIDDSIVEVESRNASFRGQVYDFAATFENTDGSTIQGFEISYQTALENGFLVSANYTYTDGETELPADSASGARTTPFFKQAKNSANLSLGYNKGPWDVRLATNFRGSYLDELGGDALADRYTDDHMQVDLTARYEVNNNIMISAEAINLNDRPESYYFGNAGRLSQYDEYGTTYGMGLRINF